MIKGEKIRLDIHNILFSIYKFNKTLDDPTIKKLIEVQKKEDSALLYNVTMNSMRYHLHCLKIINKYIKKKLRDHEKILLISAITQIVFLEFKVYAVINCSVEISKKLKLYPGLINASLKKIASKKIELRKIQIKFDDFPNWFKKNTTSLSSYEKKQFIENYYQEPDLHIVFKNSEKLNNFEEDLIKTSNVSGFLLKKDDIRKKKTFIEGDWWVQDFSSFFPLHNLRNVDSKKKFLDACAAPGGKSFQLLSRKFNVVLNDISKARLQILKSNLNRLKFSAEITNEDFRKINHNRKFDFIIIDAPCSAVGTIRKNPEILFKSNEPNFKKLNFLQETMIEKASFLLNSGGVILYMTCSFLQNETVDRINKFLKKNTNFSLYNFNLKEGNMGYSRIIKKNLMLTLPDKILNRSIDGYFAAYLKKE